MVEPVRIRSSRATLVMVAILVVCVVPVGLANPWFTPLFAVPLVVAMWLLRAGVDADADGLTVRALFGSRRVRWDEVAGLLATPRGTLRLVLRDGRRVALPVARARDLPALAVASDGRVPTLDR